MTRLDLKLKIISRYVERINTGFVHVDEDIPLDFPTAYDNLKDDGSVSDQELINMYDHNVCDHYQNGKGTDKLSAIIVGLIGTSGFYHEKPNKLVNIGLHKMLHSDLQKNEIVELFDTWAEQGNDDAYSVAWRYLQKNDPELLYKIITEFMNDSK